MGSVKGSIGQLVLDVYKIFSFWYIFTSVVRDMWTIKETVLLIDMVRLQLGRIHAKKLTQS